MTVHELWANRATLARCCAVGASPRFFLMKSEMSRLIDHPHAAPSEIAEYLVTGNAHRRIRWRGGCMVSHTRCARQLGRTVSKKKSQSGLWLRILNTWGGYSRAVLVSVTAAVLETGRCLAFPSAPKLLREEWFHVARS